MSYNPNSPPHSDREQWWEAKLASPNALVLVVEGSTSTTFDDDARLTARLIAGLFLADSGTQAVVTLNATETQALAVICAAHGHQLVAILPQSMVRRSP